MQNLFLYLQEFFICALSKLGLGSSCFLNYENWISFDLMLSCFFSDNYWINHNFFSNLATILFHIGQIKVNAKKSFNLFSDQYRLLGISGTSI